MNKATHKHKQTAERYRVRQKHSSYTTTPQHYTQHTRSVTIHWRINKYKNHVWHTVPSPQNFGRGERWKKIALSHAQNIKVDFKAYVSETYTIT